VRDLSPPLSGKHRCKNVGEKKSINQSINQSIYSPAFENINNSDDDWTLKKNANNAE